MSASQRVRELPPHWETAEVSPDRLFTIGHSSHPLTTFLGLLKQHDVEVLADTRSQPYSRYVPHFNARPLSQALLQTGIQYLGLGHQLGGRPRDPALYNDQGRVDHDLLAASRPFQAGLERLRLSLAHCRVAILCSEENPGRCHRGRLISRLLAAEGVAVQHIRGDGRLQDHLDQPGPARRSLQPAAKGTLQIRWH